MSRCFVSLGLRTCWVSKDSEVFGPDGRGSVRNNVGARRRDLRLLFLSLGNCRMHDVRFGGGVRMSEDGRAKEEGLEFVILGLRFK